MKLIRLEVECFKCVEKAELELGPGLNVLYGPNDLGKTSLGDAVRAVLLLQSTSSERKELEPWNGGGVPRVRLSFEHREQIWRVEKRFGEGSRAHALLEHSRDGQVWSKAEGQRAVDGELRKMLGWGVREPGGKGAPKGLPSSFITTALLGRASQLEAVFGADIAKDSDPSGPRAWPRRCRPSPKIRCSSACWCSRSNASMRSNAPTVRSAASATRRS